MRDVTIRELMDSLQLETGVQHRLRAAFPRLHVRLPIDPRKAESMDDRYILTMDRGGAETDFVLTVKDDHVPRDAYVDLIYKRLLPDARYTLTVDPGAGAPRYAIFADRAHDELF